MKINTEGKDYIAGGKIYQAGEDGEVDIPDEVLAKEKIVDLDGSGAIETDEIIDGLKSRVTELEAENDKLKAEIAELNALIEDDGTSDEKEALLARAKELGIEADGRWGVKKLKAAIAEKAGA